ncbi:MAG: hypothetical protein OXN17_03380 [Candidatus Poribacteria bacterium]|nr:hypothetical protein [Candidatus Poribacteria bacterium]MDE0503504.1 hypothetical protein [Candidatus Poribacteria bacterium]
MQARAQGIVFPEVLFELERFEHRDLFDGGIYVWEALHRLEAYVTGRVKELSSSSAARVMQGAVVGEDVILGENVVVEPHAYVKGPAIIGDGTEIRHGAYVRDHALIGGNCIIGHSTEVKRSILMDGVSVSHWNYIGDSILGFDVNLGAGTTLSNKKIVKTDITIRDLEGNQYVCGQQKLGAIIGDGTQVGCNAVLNPGALLGKRCMVYPLVSARGTHPNNQLIKS